MSVKRYKLAMPTSSRKIREVTIKLKQTLRLRKIELMVESGAMTERQADRARKKLVETPA